MSRTRGLQPQQIVVVPGLAHVSPSSHGNRTDPGEGERLSASGGATVATQQSSGSPPPPNVPKECRRSHGAVSACVAGAAEHICVSS
jgi:hypothetical protein